MNREPRYFYEPSSGLLVAVPLQHQDKEAILTAADFSRFSESGGSSRFHLNDNGSGRCYVRGRFDGRKVMIARYVARATRGQIVQYRDGDPLNLRPENLVLEGGPGRSDCRLVENF